MSCAVSRSDGTIYFTDPPYGIIPGESSSYSKQKEQPCNGVYRISNDGIFARVADDFDRPNGLAFSPDESVLYVKRHAPQPGSCVRGSHRRQLDPFPGPCRHSLPRMT